MSDRVNRLRLIGARHVDRDEWAKIVADATARLEERNSRWISFAAAEASPTCVPNKPRPMFVRPDQMVVDVQVLLGVEMALVEAEESLRDIEDLARDDIAESRRARLLRTIEHVRGTIAKRLATEPS